MHMHIYSYVYISRWVTRTLPPYFEMKTWLCFASPADSAKRLKLYITYDILLKSWRKLKKKKVCQSSRLSEVVDQKLYTYENNFQKFKKKTVCESSGLGEEVDQKTFHPHK